jgi:hypothetical protein
VLYILTFIACLGGQPGQSCRNIEIAWDGSPHQCMMFGQVEMARWMREHPGYAAVKGYRCVPGREV